MCIILREAVDDTATATAIATATVRSYRFDSRLLLLSLITCCHSICLFLIVSFVDCLLSFFSNFAKSHLPMGFACNAFEMYIDSNIGWIVTCVWYNRQSFVFIKMACMSLSLTHAPIYMFISFISSLPLIHLPIFFFCSFRSSVRYYFANKNR